MTAEVERIADGLFLRISNREGAQQKARRYLLEGRVAIEHVGPDGVRARVRGQGHVYTVTYRRGMGWACDCLARMPHCCHVVAGQLVVSVTDRPGR